MTVPRSILITGASSGIGEALALAYAAPEIFLRFSGRDPKRLEAVAQACRKRGAEVSAQTVDVADRDAMAAWIEAEDDACALDLVIANAGVSAETSGNAGDSVRAVMAVNLAGVLNTVLPALPRMQKRKAGKIALMSSLAAFRGLPSAPAYCASKAAVKSWGEALRGRVWRDGVRVSVVCPGFVKSRITDRNAFAMPFLMDADKAARIIKAGIAKDKARIAFPLPLVLAVQLLGALPPSWTDLLLRRMPMKE